MATVLVENQTNYVLAVVDSVDNADTYADDGFIFVGGQALIRGIGFRGIQLHELADCGAPLGVKTHTFRMRSATDLRAVRLQAANYTGAELEALTKEEIDDLADYYGLSDVLISDLKEDMIAAFISAA